MTSGFRIAAVTAALALLAVPLVLPARHKAWGREWAAAGYIAILVDGFGPRGYPQGFGPHTYDSRPAELNEVTKRPLDAYAALAYLRSRPDVIADRIGLLGWSNGG